MAEPFLTPERLASISSTGGGATRSQERDQALHDGGLAMGGSPGAKPYRPRVLYGKRRTFWPRGDAAAARIYRILEGCTKSSSIERAVSGAEYKRLAKEYAEAWVYYTTRDKPPPVRGTDHNPFRHMSDVDAERKFIRIVEDICDRSTGVLGGWWVK